MPGQNNIWNIKKNVARIHTPSKKEALFKSKSLQLSLSSGFRFEELQTAPLTEITDTLMRNATDRAKPLSII